MPAVQRSARWPTLLSDFHLSSDICLQTSGYRTLASLVQNVFKGFIVPDRAQQGQTQFVVFEQASGKL
jgi:hypothetical protein